jgi:hypothetical protein
MTAAELAKDIGKEGNWVVNAGAGVTVKVKVVDARESGAVEENFTASLP